MLSNPGRRNALLLLGSAIIPAAAHAQSAPPAPAPEVIPGAPPVPPSVAPAITLPVAPAATPVHPAVAAAAIDKTKSYYVFFDQTIDANSMRALRRQLANLTEAGVPEITLVIDSPGGLVEQMLITYSFILALPNKVNTHAQGFVQSAATMLFLAGQQRSADRLARFVFHPTQTTVAGVMGEQQIRERASAFDMVGDVMTGIFRDRTTMPASEIARFERETVVYSAERAREVGVVQTVADLRIPGDGKAKIVFLD